MAIPAQRSRRPRAISSRLDGLPLADAPALCAAVSRPAVAFDGGSSGILSRSSLPRWARGSEIRPTGSPPCGPESSAWRTTAERNRGSHDARRLVPALVVLEAGGDLAAASRAAAEGATRTASIAKARAGRSSYVRADALLGVADPGAMAIAVALDALLRS